MILWININEAKTAPKSGSKNKLIEAAKWSQHFQTPPQLNWSKWSVKTESTLAIHLHFLWRNQTHLIHVRHLQKGTVLKITFISYSSMCFYFKRKFTVGCGLFKTTRAALTWGWGCCGMWRRPAARLGGHPAILPSSSPESLFIIIELHSWQPIKQDILFLTTCSSPSSTPFCAINLSALPEPLKAFWLLYNGGQSGVRGATGLCAQEHWCLSSWAGSVRAEGRAMVWGGSGGHSVWLCCNRSPTGHSDVDRRAKTDYCVGECSGVNPPGSVKWCA